MDRDDALALVRDLMKISGTILIANNVVDELDWRAITGVVIVVFPVIWSHITRMQLKTAIVKAAITGDPTPPGPLGPITTTDLEKDKKP